MKFGDRLRQAREARGVTLDDVFQETHIAKRYLAALERSDLGALPGGVFDKGYIRSYAQFVDIDPEPILTAYQLAKRRAAPEPGGDTSQLLQELALQADKAVSPRAALPTPPLAGALALLAIAGLVGGVWLLLPDQDAPQSREISEPVPPTGIESRRKLPSPVVDIPTSDMTSAETIRAEPEPPRDVNELRASRLTIAESGLGTGVVEHALTGRAERFAEGTRVFFWTRVLNGEKGMVLRHVWKLGDERVMYSELVIGGPHWRTYSSYTLPPGSTGRWTVEAIGPDGRLLARKEFVCSGSPDLETGVLSRGFEASAD